jgi:hypothetical protein
MICGAYGDQGRRKAVGRESQPSLIFIFGARIEVAQNSIVHSTSACEEIVGEVGMRVARKAGEIKDTAAIHEFGVGHETSIGDVVAAAYLVGLFIDFGSLSILDKMEDTFDTEMMGEVQIEIGCAAIDAAGKIVRVSGREAASDLEVDGARCGWPSLSAQHGCCAAYQTNKDENSIKQIHPLAVPVVLL